MDLVPIALAGTAGWVKNNRYPVLLADVLIGPTLTLIVFKKNKKTLVFDLSVITLLQLSAFLYGAWVIYSERPHYLTFAYDRFHVVLGNDLPAAPPGKPGAYPQWGWGPRLVYAELPMNVVQSGDALFTSLAGSNKLALQLSWYRPYPPPLNVLQDQSLDPIILKEDARLAGPAQALAQSKGMNIEDLLVFPVMGRVSAGTALVAKEDGRLIGILNIRPWPS